MTLLEYGCANTFIRNLIVLKRDADIRRNNIAAWLHHNKAFLSLMLILQLWKNNYVWYGKYNNT